MDNVSKVIFTCLAIGYTFLIYQNNQLKDDVETLKGYAQLDTDKAWERMDSIEDKIKINYSNFEKQNVYNEELAKVIADMQVNIDIAFDNFDIGAKNREITDAKIKANSDTIEYIQGYLVENFGNK